MKYPAIIDIEGDSTTITLDSNIVFQLRYVEMLRDIIRKMAESVIDPKKSAEEVKTMWGDCKEGK